jgi:hypothetical protein
MPTAADGEQGAASGDDPLGRIMPMTVADVCGQPVATGVQ